MKKEAIVQFAKKQGYDDAEHIGEWKGYDVYEPVFEGADVAYVGPPLVILVKGNAIRMSTVEESYQQLDDSSLKRVK